jgi:N,N'-diacetyllegionaminate synthase
LKITLFTKDNKPTTKEAIEYLRKNCDDLAVFKGQRHDAIPKEAYGRTQDLLVSYLSSWVIPGEILEKTALWNINFHPGPPEYPGTGCFNFAIYNGEKSYGVTANLMERKVDNGKIIGVKRFPIPESASIYDLSIMSYEYMHSLFLEVMESVIKKKLPASREDWKRRPYTRRELEELCRVDADMPRAEIEKRIRATRYPGMPGAHIDLFGHKFEYISERSTPRGRRKVFIIAEAGINHNGDIETAKEMVDLASSAGADAIKFQSFKAERIVSKFAPKAEYQKRMTGEGESQLEMLKKFEMNEEMHKEIIAYCKERNIAFLSTPFDLESVRLLDELGLEIFKIPSGEVTNLPFLRKVGELKKKIILSTGMSYMEEVKKALDILIDSGTPKDHITLLHCNTEYPTPYHDANLLAMRRLKEAFNVKVGYSDHTPGAEASIAAAALGAEVVEKHFTIDKKMEGPDHQASLGPEELIYMIRAIRNIEKALGSSDKRPSPSEAKNRDVARKSIVAARDIKKGEVFTQENLTTKRPGTGISPMEWEMVLGKRADRDFSYDEAICL